MDVEKAESLVSERIRKKQCVECGSQLSRERSELWWCSKCRNTSKCILCHAEVDAGESRCWEHRQRTECVL